MMYGWSENILRVDLSRGKVTKQPFPLDLGVSFLGGAGVNAKILYDEVGPEIAPYDPENRLIVGVGPFTGTIVPSGSRTEITCKNPLTNAFGDGNFGGYFGPILRWAGYGHVVIHGRAQNPVYLWIDDSQVEIRDATQFAGRDVFETDTMLKEEIGDPEIGTLINGPAGENLVRYAVPIGDISRAPGFGASGSVMGSKKLKAIAVRGTGGIKIADPSEELFELCEKMRKSILASPRIMDYQMYGSLRNMDSTQRKGGTGWKNLSEGEMPIEAFENAKADRFAEIWNHARSPKACFNCPVACAHPFLVADGPYAGTYGEKIEYAQANDCKMMGIANPKFTAKWCIETMRLGVDTRGPQNAIAWAMECVEKGILDNNDLGGLDFRFGDEEQALAVLKMIIERKGIGDLLAEGAYLASRKIGKGSERCVMHIKGKALGQDPRIGFGFGLAEMTSTRGADHLKGQPNIEFFFFDKSNENRDEALFGHPKATQGDTPEGKGHEVVWYEDINAVIDALGICKRQTKSLTLDLPGYDLFAPVLTFMTGRKFTEDDLRKAGKRIYALERAFNARCGLTRKDDTIPDKFFVERSTSKLTPVPIYTRQIVDKMLDEYYTVRGCDLETGVPTKKTLEELGLRGVAEDLEKRHASESRKREKRGKQAA